MNGAHVAIVLLFALVGWLIYPKYSSEVDALAQRVDAERNDESEQRRRSL